MKESILKNKSYEFALKIVAIYKSITEHKREFTLSRQLLKSGTSIGANIREAEYLDEDYSCNKLLKLNQELLKMLISTINTMKAKLK